MPFEIKQGILLAPYTIYKIGGLARFFAEVKSAKELQEAIEYAQRARAPFFILGAGSNVLISDRGFDGLIIRMAGGQLKVEGFRLIVDAGVMMARAVLETARAGLTGFEWAIGVPGTIGGSVRGNAGCFGGEMKDVVESVEVFDARTATNYQLPTANCKFAYRDSIFKKCPEWIILSAVLNLEKGEPEKIKEKIADITRGRGIKQDIGTQSCGCIFKNVPWAREDSAKEKILAAFPELRQFSEKPNIPASFLIDRAGLKNARVGSVFVSSKHANFFVNEGGGTAQEVMQLIEKTKDTIQKKYGIRLEEEIQSVGL